MMEIKLLATKYTAAADRSRGLKRSPRLKQDHEKQPNFLKCRSGSLKRGAEIDLLNMTLEDFNMIVTSLKNSSNTALRLYNRSLGSDGEFEPIRFRPSDATTCAALERFSRALARAVGAGGWVQELELGFLISRQDVKGLSEALSCSSTLQHLSLANSALGDERLQLLARSLCECLPLQVLDLSGCALTDASVTSVTSIIKVGVRRTADTEWRLSLRESGGNRSKRRTPRLTASQGLLALDLSFNMFTDDTSRQLCDVLRLGATLEALNLQGNQLRKKSAQMYLLVYQIWGLPRLVDLRKNLDGKDVGVLEDGKHLRCFSCGYAPFRNTSQLLSPIQNLPEQEKKKSSQRKISGPRRSLPPDPLVMRDAATSGGSGSEKIPIHNLITAVGQNTRKDLDHGSLAGWSSPTNRVALIDASPQERESTKREECHSRPQREHQGDDQRAVHHQIDPLIPSLHVGDGVDQISPRSFCTKTVDQISSSCIKEHPDLLLKSENSKNASDDVYGDLSSLHSEGQSSDQLGGRLGENQSRPLSPIRDPATPELTSTKHPKRSANIENEDRTNLRNRSSDESPFSSCQRARRSVDDENCDHTPKSHFRQGPTSAGRSQPTEWKLEKSAQAHSKQSRKGTDPKLGPRKESGDRQSRGSIVNCQNLKRKESARASQHHPLHSTSEWQREESEWGDFMWEMARSLMRLREGLDVLMEPSKPDAEIAHSRTVTDLSHMFETFSS
ncbi:unnamed protein product [Calypogeia fissa]